MSPEQVRGKELDSRTDLFSFGVVLYEMVTGALPFRGDTSGVIFHAILERAPTLPVRVNPEIPTKLEEIIKKCLEKDRDLRFQSAADLRTDLKRLKRDTESGRQALPSSGLLIVAKKYGLALSVGILLVCLVLGGVLYSIYGWRWSNTSRAKIAHKQFTFLGDAYWPAISPDGMFVAYVSKKYGEEQKLMVQAPNGSTLELARGTYIRGPRWSPDGSEVLFFRYEPELFRVERSAKSWGFSVVSRLGGVARPIAFAAYACWLKPNGAEIVTATSAEGSGFKGITLVNKLTGETQDVTLSAYETLHDIDCSTRTGLILAVLRNAEKFQIRVFRPDGSDQRSVIEESDQIFSARWSPAGDSIYYLHGKGSTTELSRISIKDKHAEPVAIANGLQTGEFFTLSADGSRLAYTREYGHSDLWQLRWQSAGAKPEIKRLTSGTFHYGAPSFSPDGRWMSFVLGPNEDETNIYKMPSAGGEPVQLTYFEHATTTSPAWSPDGQRIAFVSDQNGTPRVWMISANGGTPQPLEKTNASNTNYDLAWWPSDEVVYQKAGRRNYLRINDKTQTEENVIQNDESKGFLPRKPIFSPERQEISR
jgi:Tol biopolymer transport system component